MLKDQNNPAVLGSIAEVLKKSNEVAVAEQAKESAAAAMRYEGWKVETDWKKAKPRSEKSAEDTAHNLAGKALKKEKEIEGKTHTTPKTDKEKKLAALAEPKDKITHADVLKGRGVTKEDVELEEAMSDADKETMKKRAAMARPELEKTKDVTRRFGGGEKGAKNVERGFRSAIKRDYKKMSEEWEAIEEALHPDVAKALASVPKGVEVHMKHKETGKINVAKFPGGANAVKAAKEHEAEMSKQGYEVHKRKIMEEKTLSEILDEARGRPRKNPAPVAAKKSDEDDGDDYGPDRGPEADQNIQNHLKKSIDSNGEHHVKFADGSSHKVPAHVAHKVLSGLQKLKPADRAKAQDHIYQSHKNLMSVHKMLG